MAPDPHHQRSFAYLSMFTFFMLLLVCGDNFLVMFIGWEGVGVTSYLLISFWFTRVQATKSALQAILVNRVGDWAFLIGLFGLFWLFGTLEYSTLFSIAPMIHEALFTLVALGLLVGAMAKSAQIGLHTWLPNAMEGPTPVSALLHAATMVVAGVFLLLRVSPLLEYSETALLLLLWIGSLTAFMAATTGLFQNDLKRVIAYSTCSQLGMLMVACGLSQYNAALFHLVNHAFFKALLFLSAGAVIHALNDEQDLRKYGGLVTLLPFCYILMLIGSFSLMALPFLTGYYSKEVIILSSYAAYSISGHLAYWISTVAAAFTALYSIRSLYLTFLSRPNGPKANYLSVHEPPVVMALPLAVLALFSLFFGYVTQQLFVSPGSAIFGNALFQHPTHVIEGEWSIPLLNRLLPVVGALLAPLLLLALYTAFPGFLIGLLSTKVGKGLYRFFNRAYLFDGLYARLAALLLEFGYITAKTIDRGVLELLGPYGLTNLLSQTARNWAKLDTGFIPHYTLLMLIGLLAFIMFVFYLPDPRLFLLCLILVVLLT
jgi:NADH-ubiquinone oxidoreductase chain 5